MTLKISPTVESDKDPNIIEIYYKPIIPIQDYIQPRVQLEIGCRSLREPFEKRPISTLVDETFPGSPFSLPPIDIPTVIPQRTFLEKLFLLHEEFKKPSEKIRHERLSRHLYDIYQLSETTFSEYAIRNKDLYQTIVEHRHKFTKVGGVDYNSHNPKTISPIPPESEMKSWREDYERMQEQMIYGESPQFDDLIKAIHGLIEKMKTVDWEFDLKF